MFISRTELALWGSGALKAGEGRPAARAPAAVQFFSQTFYRHRRFLPPLLLQRGGSSTTRAAATATFSSPMYIKCWPNSFFFKIRKLFGDL